MAYANAAVNQLQNIYNATGYSTPPAGFNPSNPAPYSTNAVGVYSPAQTQLGAADSTQAPTPTYADPNATAAAATTAANNQTKADNNGYLQDQAAQLRDLLGRNDTNLTQGLQGNQDQYDTGVGTVNQQKDAQVTTQNQGKLSAYDQINQNANNGYRSLAQIIGRASGTGSSAYQDLLPSVIGQDTSSQRQGATDTFGQNLSNIDASTAASLADLMKQKKANESSVRGAYQTNVQNLNNQLAQNAGQYAQNNNGGFAAVKAAQTPFQNAINDSRNATQGYFDQFRTPFTPQAVDPNLAAYQSDRSVVNAQGQPGTDSSNPYASLLRRKLQQGA